MNMRFKYKVVQFIQHCGKLFHLSVTLFLNTLSYVKSTSSFEQLLVLSPASLVSAEMHKFAMFKIFIEFFVTIQRQFIASIYKQKIKYIINS